MILPIRSRAAGDLLRALVLHGGREEAEPNLRRQNVLDEARAGVDRILASAAASVTQGRSSLAIHQAIEVFDLVAAVVPFGLHTGAALLTLATLTPPQRGEPVVRSRLAAVGAASWTALVEIFRVESGIESSSGVRSPLVARAREPDVTPREVALAARSRRGPTRRGAPPRRRARQTRGTGRPERRANSGGGGVRPSPGRVGRRSRTTRGADRRTRLRPRRAAGVDRRLPGPGALVALLLAAREGTGLAR